MLMFAVASLLSMAMPFQADQGKLQNLEQIRVVPVPKTPESNTVFLALAVPQNGEVKSKNPVWVQFRLEGYPIGTNSPTSRYNELVNSKVGQSIHVIIDNEPYFPVYNRSVDPFNEDGYYYDTSFKLKLPQNLSSGIHTIRVFPARSYGESLKNENNFQISYFYVGSKTGDLDTDITGPYLTYNEPSNNMQLVESKPVLLDFLISNCELSSDGYKVILTVDGKFKRTLTSWQPYYIYGLKKGSHTINIQLVDEEGHQVPGSYNDVERTITIH